MNHFLLGDIHGYLNQQHHARLYDDVVEECKNRIYMDGYNQAILRTPNTRRTIIVSPDRRAGGLILLTPNIYNKKPKSHYRVHTDYHIMYTYSSKEKLLRALGEN